MSDGGRVLRSDARLRSPQKGSRVSPPKGLIPHRFLTSTRSSPAKVSAASQTAGLASTPLRCIRWAGRGVESGRWPPSTSTSGRASQVEMPHAAHTPDFAASSSVCAASRKRSRPRLSPAAFTPLSGLCKKITSGMQPKASALISAARLIRTGSKECSECSVEEGKNPTFVDR